MIKQFFVITTLIATATAESRCSWTMNYWTSNTCDGAPTSVRYDNYPIKGCKQYTEDAGTYAKVFYCNSDVILMGLYSNSDCTKLQEKHHSPYIAIGGVDNACRQHPYLSHSYITTADHAVTGGNIIGLTWFDGWGIFFCQAMLFGLCAGYD